MDLQKGQKIRLLVLSGLAVMMTALLVLSRMFPIFVSRIYTGKIFPVVTWPLRFLADSIPFSLGETVFVGFLIFVLVRSVWRIVCAVRYGTWKPILQGLHRMTIILLVLVILFPIMGGFNYSGQTFSERVGLETTATSAEELEQLCRTLNRLAVTERNVLPQDENGVTQSPLTILEIMDRAQEGYDAIGQTYPWLAGNYGTPKIALLSDVMSYLRISGIYPYFIPEGIVNTNTPVLSIPHTVCHEMAHQRGIAREDEANFVGYLAAIHHSEAIFRYSGFLEAYAYSMDALYRVDSERWKAVYETTHRGILRDLAYISDVWAPYIASDNVLGEISTSVNDVYLKGNAVEGGVSNYGHMVDLLIAYHRDLTKSA